MDDKVRVATIQRMKAEARKIVAVTAYDYPTGRLADEAGVDIVHVGDSLANILGYADEIPVTLDMMVHHAAAVRRGGAAGVVDGRPPFYDVQGEPRAGRWSTRRGWFRKAGVEAVKMEGGTRDLSDDPEGGGGGEFP